MKKQILAAAVLAVASFGAYAAEGTTTDSIAPSYTYVDARIARNAIEVDPNMSDVNFDGYNINGSFEFAEQFHVFGGYESTNNDEFGVDIDLTQTQVGIGWHPSVADNADFLLEASWINRKAEVSAFGVSADEDEDAYRVSAGFRGAFNKYVVGSIKANYTDGKNSDGEFSPTAGLEVRFNDMWSLIGEAEFAESEQHYTVGVRASF
ncbi:hypothetical protein LF41_1911 [Lysobacter dokdonensis DS-58]|uniref:Outer membrane protein beta-barrel domain-containing protein n=1 Tax=Lysobacter dokdonensis DS-58 TaxID=1300345 RepID=A0A0A2WCM8_9GAMM|nr:hypothetical protein [Lysobacter dokdonensis]KGQ17836.1 hypothetical protein LF41_1911 [Lysobacter dokdonensis DS-58]